MLDGSSVVFVFWHQPDSSIFSKIHVCGNVPNSMDCSF